jgi:TM2 domain-containing membrane protein YozV
VNRTVAAALALLAVLSLGAAAATLDTATVGGSGGAGGGDAESVGSGGSFSFGGYNVSETTAQPPRLPPIVGQLLGLVLLLFFGLGLVQFLREHGVRGLLTVALVGVVLVGGLWLLLTGLGATDGLFQQGQGGLGSGGSPELPGGSSQGPADASSPVTDPPTVLFALFGVVLVGAVALLARSTGDDLSQPDPDETSSGPTDVAAVGRAAGRAADRIETSDGFDNEVYRAWDEMTRHLDVANPEASTPAEFATAAVDAGMAREDVDALTDVFEAVRYGAVDATDAREREAVEALRRIERAYTETDAAAADHGSGEAA